MTKLQILKLKFGETKKIFECLGTGFFRSHSMRVVPFLLPNRILRLFYSSRCDDDMMYPNFVDVNPDNPSEILFVNEHPILELGKPGAFDDSGITIGSVQKLGNDYFAYYTGWKRRRYKTPFELSIGIARLTDNFSKLSRISEGPIISQNFHHPFLVAGPFVRSNVAKPGFDMWYCSGTKWFETGNSWEPLYSVCKATSLDGLNWNTSDNEIKIPYKFEGEVISAPWVVEFDNFSLMFYCFRGSQNSISKRYKIGVAISEDGINWTRKDEKISIPSHCSSWDGEMQCYPAVWKWKEKINLFYSGNNVGKGGFGFCEMEIKCH